MTTESGRVLVAADQLTEREMEVMQLLAQGLTNHAIAMVLIVEDTTVRTHVSNIMAKLDVHTRTAAVVEAQALGLVPAGGELHPVSAAIVVLSRLHPNALQEAISVLSAESGEAR